MKTQIGSYTLKVDRYQFSLYENVVIKEGDNAGKTREQLIGHWPKLEQLAERLYHLELSKSDASTLDEMLTVMKATRQLIKTAGWTKE